jgi:S-adenosylmethionine:tRNA ribosyltransferase-isomerase
MDTDAFDYDLPPELIAQQPRADRDSARLLVLGRADGSIRHRHFRDLPDLLNPGDLLVLNDTRVIPARLVGRRASTGGRWEGLFLRSASDDSWEILCQTRGRLHAGEIVEIGDCLRLRLESKLPDGRWHARPVETAGLTTLDLVSTFGAVPLPPYIRKGRAVASDRERYQTIYAREAGAIAAPTAGLHFTVRVFDQLQSRGVGWTFVTLHVGAGTFRPIESPDVAMHQMHSEWGSVSEEVVNRVSECKSKGGRVIAVGTTSVRALESAARSGKLAPWTGDTNLFIYPPFRFQVVDVLITNFHLPKSTLLVLVSAFAGIDSIRAAYRSAIAEKYRFYSYGDVMLIH